MATTAEQRLQRDVGATEASLSTADATALLEEAAETYTNATAAAAYARVLAIQGILASSAKLTSYKQNNSSEQASDVFKNLSALLTLWEAKTEAALLAAGGAGTEAFFTVASGTRGH